MYALLGLISSLALCNGITVTYNIRDHRNIVPNLIKGLSPMFISCKLNEIAIISAPVVNCEEVAYYLYKPYGKSIQLELPRLNTEEYGLTGKNSNKKYAIVENITEYITAAYSLRYRTLNVNHFHPTNFNMQEMEEVMTEYDLMIGPLLEEDHGKWILVIYFKDRDKRWVKLFQLITVKITANTKEELPPIFIPCGLNAIIIISVPVVNCEEVAYYLYKPSGDGIQLDLPRPNTAKAKFEPKYAFTETYLAEHGLANSTDIIIRNVSEYVTVTYPKRTFKVLPSYLMSKKTIESDTVIDDSLKNAEKNMVEYDFMIGPLLEEDHGNWVLSTYCRRRKNDWIEIFQVITIAIIARVPMDQEEVALKKGSTFNLSFAYSIKGIEACSLAPPESTLDRYYDRNRLLEPDKCGYTVPNVTIRDAGVWKVTGVGPIVYEGYVVLYNEHRRQEKLDHDSFR